MKKLMLTLLVSLFPLFLISAEIDSIEKLKRFMEEGQQKGYFPKTVLLPNFGGPKKLREVDLEFRTIIHWDSSSKCPSHEDEMILALGDKSHSIVCNAGNTVGILGSGNDWVDDATGNDIYYSGRGDDIVDVGSGNDILIFDLHWGKDKVQLHSQEVDTKSILGYDGSYPWKYSDFIIFGKEVKRTDIIWDGNRLYHVKTGDSIDLNTKKVNILFASDPKTEYLPVPTQKRMVLEELKSESLFKEGKTLYLAKGNEGLHIVNVNDPQNALVLSTLVLPGRAMDVVVKDNIAYVGQGDYYLSGKRGWVSIVDVKDKKAPKLLKTLKFGNNIRSLAIGETKLYISDTHFSNTKKRMLHIYDIHNPAMPTLIASSKLNYYMRQVLYFGDRLYFISNHQRLKVLDVNDPMHPTLLKESPLFNQKVYSLALKDDLLVYTQKDHTLKMFRLSKEKQTKALCTLQTMQFDIQPYGTRNTLVIEDGLVYSAENTYGISISSIKACKVLNILPVWNTKRVNTLTKLGNTLVSFSTNEKGRVYFLQKDLIHEEMSVSKRRKMGTVPKASASLSREQLQTLLYQATTRENVKEIKRLCALGANPNENGHERYTPMEIASRLGKTEALKILLSCGGKATKECMFLAALTEKEEAMKILEQHGVPVTERNRRKSTTLHYIAQDGSVDMVKYLISKGVPYDAVNKKGESPLTWANYGTNCPVIEYLESLYPPTYKKVGNEKCKNKKIKEKIQRLSYELRRLKRTSKPQSREAKSIGIKLKGKQKGDMLNVKFMLVHPMVSPYIAEKRRIYLDYIDHVTLKVGERVIFDMSNNFNLSRNPMIKLKVKNCKTDKKLQLIVRDNQGLLKNKTKDTTIRRSNKPVPYDCTAGEGKVEDFHTSHPEFWKATTITRAVKNLYGNVTYEEGHFKIKMPEFATNPTRIPLHIQSDLDLESIAVLSHGNTYPAIAVFSLPENTTVDYNLKIKVRETGEQLLVIIAKGRDGKFYKSIKLYEVAGSPPCGD